MLNLRGISRYPLPPPYLCAAPVLSPAPLATADIATAGALVWILVSGDSEAWLVLTC